MAPLYPGSNALDGPQFVAAESYFDKYGVPPLTDADGERIEAEWKGEVARASGVTFTFDTGMLIALKRRKVRATQASSRHPPPRAPADRP